MSRAARVIHLADYDPHWPQLFEEERTRLQAAIGERVADIQHVGSTSIPGIAAKPIIDIAVHLRSLIDALYCITPLTELGYECLGEFGIPGRIYFRKPTDSPLPGQSHDGLGRTHQVHMYELDHDQYFKTWESARQVARLFGRDLYPREADRAIVAWELPQAPGPPSNEIPMRRRFTERLRAVA